MLGVNLLAPHALVKPHRLHHVGGRHHVVDDLRVLLAADRAVHDDEDQHQHGRQEIDRDRARPGGKEVGGVAQHGRGTRQRHEPLRPYRLRRQHLIGGGGKRLRLRGDSARDILHHRLLAAPQVLRAAVGDRRDEGGREIVGGAADGGSDRGLLQAGDDAGERHGLLAELVGAQRHRPVGGDERAHPRDVLATLLVECLHRLARLGDLGAEAAQVVRHLRQELHDRAGARRAGQRAGCALVGGEAREACRGKLDVGKQRLRRERVRMRLVERVGIALRGAREVLLDRGGAGERRRIQPRRHCHDHGRTEHDRADQGVAVRCLADMRHQPHEEGPEGVDADETAAE